MKKYLYRIQRWFKRFFGLKGSWKWACKQMRAGEIVFRITDTGSAKYKLDDENQQRILSTHRFEASGWKNAKLFLDDFECTDWVVYVEKLYVRSYRKRWVNYGVNLKKYRVDGYLKPL